MFDINHYGNHFKTIIVPIFVLLPTHICKCNRSDASFPEDMKDPEALKGVVEMFRNAQGVCDAKTRLEAVLWLKRMSSKCSFSDWKIIQTFHSSTMRPNRLDAVMEAACLNDIPDVLDLRQHS